MPDGRVALFAGDIPGTDNPSGATRQLPLHSSHRNAPSGRSGVPVGLFSEKSTPRALFSKTLDL